jgi:preprotein translocase subunit SecD
MSRKSFAGILIGVAILAGVINGQGPLEIRAAASTAVTGWRQMVSPSGDQVWVSPTNSLTSTDVERAEARTLPSGGPAVAIVLTADGAKKMAALSADQTNKPIALLLDGKLIWAPVVRGPIEKEALLTGGPGGLAPEQIQRLLAGFKGR